MKTVSNDIEVFVADGERNILAGRMYLHFRRGSESASFIYDDQYLANPRGYQLDPALPLVSGTLQTPVGRALFGAFADSFAGPLGPDTDPARRTGAGSGRGHGPALDERDRLATRSPR